MKAIHFSTICRFFLVLPISAAAMCLSLVLPVSPIPFITQPAYSLLSYALLLIQVRAMLYPDLPARHYPAMTETTAKAFVKYLTRLWR